MKSITIILIFFFSSVTSELFSQDNFSQFIEYQKKGDTLNIRLLLEKWEKENPRDADYFIASFNYYFSMSMTRVVKFHSKPTAEQEMLVIYDNDSSAKEPKGYFYDGIIHDSEIISKAFDFIDRGISIYPNRLDMRLGKCYALLNSENYEGLVNEIKKTVDYSVIIKNKWLWKNNEAIETGEEALLESMHNYVAQIYNTEEDTLVIFIRNISEIVLKHYPNSVVFISNIAISYMIENNFEEALKYLLKANKIAPEDYIVLNNIAQIYTELNDKENAIKYYNLCVKYGDDYTVDFAKKQIEALNKKK
jgi:tetratricopeptide (TPR) repeat protein